MAVASALLSTKLHSGASTHPGSGLPAVLVSARLTTERILVDAGAL
jgi:phytoene dehydrogenase-like protein